MTFLTELAPRGERTRAWLQLIFQERFGGCFELVLDGSGCLSLSPSGCKGRILFSGAAHFFSDQYRGGDIPCSLWDPASEGFNAPLGKPIPAPGMSGSPEVLIRVGEAGFDIEYDIPGLIFWALTRWEELDSNAVLDKHDRFPATSSHAYRHNYLQRPVVDEWLDILGQVIVRLWPQINLKEHIFSIKVSHDVDDPSRYRFRRPKALLRSMVGDVVRRKDYKSFLLAPWIRLSQSKELSAADPFNTFSWLMDVSEKNNLKSAFYFICGRTSQSLDAEYEPENPIIQNLMRLIHSRGHEIGLHPSYNTYLDSDALIKEAIRLKNVCRSVGVRQDVWGGRMHFLRWRQPTTMRIWEAAGMNYDSTLGYADLPGFRCGTCYEYPAFDPIDFVGFRLRIRPLIVMECTVMAERYMGLGARDGKALKKFKELQWACKAVRGVFTLLWHNNELDNNHKRKIYSELLENRS